MQTQAVPSMSHQSHESVTERLVTAEPGCKESASRRWKIRWRVAWTLLSIFAVECLVFGLAMLPAAVF
jgi:hypothetical protein